MSYLVSDAKVILIHRIIATSARLADFARDRQITINEYLSGSPFGRFAQKANGQKADLQREIRYCHIFAAR